MRSISLVSCCSKVEDTNEVERDQTWLMRLPKPIKQSTRCVAPPLRPHLHNTTIELEGGHSSYLQHTLIPFVLLIIVAHSYGRDETTASHRGSSAKLRALWRPSVQALPVETCNICMQLFSCLLEKYASRASHSGQAIPTGATPSR